MQLREGTPKFPKAPAKKPVVHKKQKQAKNREAKRADQLVEAFNSAQAQLKGEADALSETREVVTENDVAELKRTIDKLNQEKADLASQVPPKNSQRGFGSFKLQWPEELSRNEMAVDYAHKAIIAYSVLKVTLFVCHILLMFSLSFDFDSLLGDIVIPLLFHLSFMLPVSMVLWNLSAYRWLGRYEWGFYRRIHRRSVVLSFLYNIQYWFIILLLFFSYIGPQTAHVFDTLSTLTIFLITRYVGITYHRFTVIRIKHHTYDVTPLAAQATTQDLRTEAAKRGKLVFADNLRAQAIYSYELYDSCKLEGVENFSLDPVVQLWKWIEPQCLVEKEGRRQFTVSVELLAQLNQLAVTLPTEKLIAYERIEFAAKNICSVNSDKYDFVDGNHTLLHTVALAKALYHQQVESVSQIPF